MNAALDSVADVASMQDAIPCEEFVRFGPNGSLVGILSGPRHKGPILLLPSAGLQPRSGPFRLHALLARRLAEAGVRSFRFDIPGVGEAPRLPDCDAAQATISAINQLQAQHAGEVFAVGGICSAADTGWEVVSIDPRVTALLLLDGVSFAGPWYRYARTLDVVRRLPREWRHFLRKIAGRLRGTPRLDSAAFRTWPTLAQAREQFAAMVSRGTRVLCIYSGGYADRFLHPRQFEWSFGAPTRDPRVVMHYWPDCDHTYFARAQRERLLATITAWMSEMHGARP